MNNVFGVFPLSDEYLNEAEALAQHLNTRLLSQYNPENPEGIILTLGPLGLTLKNGGLEMRGDMTKLLPRLKQDNLGREFLVKAAKIKGTDHQPVCIDATAGMGEDSMLLAAIGYKVRLYEYDPVIAALLRDALKRAADTEELRETVSRMELIEGNSIEAMKELDFVPDVIVLDPMFPERRKSASVKKKFQLLQQLEFPCDDEENLLKSAMQAHPHRIVIKRPLKGPFLAGVKPSYSISGKAIRYDCIVLTG